MLIVMHASATSAEVEHVCVAVRAAGLRPHPIPGRLRTAIGVTGNTGQESTDQFAELPGVVEVIRVTRPYKLTSREMKPEDTVVQVGGVTIGGGGCAVIAGPCAVESAEQTLRVAHALKERGAHVLRGGAFKPRTSPYAFQGLGRDGLEILARARRETGLPVISEALTTEVFEAVETSADVIQIGARNMQNFALLKRAGGSSKPVLLKRGMSATMEEFLLAAEYIMSEGNTQVILCERGIRTFADHSRFTLDLGIVPVLKQVSHLPVVVDPSHAAGRRDMVIPLARAAVAVGADGLMVEVHPNPDGARSDGAQSLTVEMFGRLMDDVRRLGSVMGRGEEVRA
jgi:3-deoxy-7-phosphoheptulonate synthase